MEIPPSEMLPDARFQEIVRQLEVDKGFHQFSPTLFVLHLLDLADGLYVSREQVSQAGHKYDVRGVESELSRLTGTSGYLQDVYTGQTGSTVLYRMVGRGREQYIAVYRPKLAPSDAPQVFLLEAGKPRTAHVRLGDLFAHLQGGLRICDPYYGSGSLYRLDLLKHCGPIQFLTQTPDAGERSQLPRALSEYTREHPTVEFRRYSGRDLHDRHILADAELILLGHGLKDVGNRESFIIRLRKELVGDLLEDLRASFDAKWNSATPL